MKCHQSQSSSLNVLPCLNLSLWAKHASFTFAFFFSIHMKNQTISKYLANSSSPLLVLWEKLWELKTWASKTLSSCLQKSLGSWVLEAVSCLHSPKKHPQDDSFRGINAFGSTARAFSMSLTENKALEVQDFHSAPHIYEWGALSWIQALTLN